MNDVFEYRIHIEQFSLLLLWLMLLSFYGVVLLAVAMHIVSGFFLTKEGISFSIFRFELPFSYKRFKDLIGDLSAKTKDTVRLHHRLDLVFMLFAYPCLFFAGWYVLHIRQAYVVDHAAYDVLWIPFLAWLLDYLENQIALRCLQSVTLTQARLLLIFSLLKWFFVAVYVVLILMVLFGR